MIERQLDRFLEHGYRPKLQSHLVVRRRDVGIEEGFYLMPGGEFVGWTVDAFPMDHTQRIHGGVFPTVKEALEDSLVQLDRLLEMRKKR